MKHGTHRSDDPGSRAWRHWFVLGMLALGGVALRRRKGAQPGHGIQLAAA